MARIQASGVALDPPILDADELMPIEQQLKREFRVQGRWTRADRREILIGLGFALGRHRLEGERPTSAQVAARIRSVIKAANQIQEILGREAGGFLPSDPVAQEAWFRIMEFLGQHPGIGSRDVAPPRRMRRRFSACDFAFSASRLSLMTMAYSLVWQPYFCTAIVTPRIVPPNRNGDS